MEALCILQSKVCRAKGDRLAARWGARIYRVNQRHNGDCDLMGTLVGSKCILPRSTFAVFDPSCLDLAALTLLRCYGTGILDC